MVKSLAFDLDPIITNFQYLGLANLYAVNNFSESVEIDGSTGIVSINPFNIVTAAKKSVSDDLVEPMVSAIMDVANGGVAVFGSSEEISKKTAICIPWVVISDFVFRFQGIPAGLRKALGIEGATTDAETIDLFRQNVGRIPDWLTQGNFVKLLRRDWVALPRGPDGGGGGVGDGEKPPKPPGKKPGTGVGIWAGITLPDATLAKDAALCLLHGDWNGLGGNWWGWAFGWQVCLDKECAEKVAKLLISLGGGSALLKSLGEVLAAETIAIGIKALSLTAGALLAIYALFLGLNIRAVNWEKGVCIQGNWPIVDGPGAFVWAVAGS
jgi:hypothetical protein